MFYLPQRIICTLLTLLLLSNAAFALNIAIIESQSAMGGHNMDDRWQSIATGMGHTAAIHPQIFLDNNSFFASTDMLIVSSGVIALPANRVNTLLQFVQQGGDVYIQGEYLCSYETNQAFQTIVNTLGGNFSWTATENGDLNPMNVSGSLAQNNVAVSSLTYYWYGCYGWGCDVQAFLEYQGNYYGFYFSASNPAYGKIITTTDQDWVKDLTSPALLQNIITHLSNPSLLPATTSSGSVNLGTDTTLCASTLQLDAQLLNANYSWSTGAVSKTIMAAVPGTYSVTVTIGSCTYTDAIQLTSAAAVQVALGQDESVCQGETVTIDAGNPGAAFSWSNGESAQTITASQNGTFSVTVTNASGCSGTDSKTLTFYPLPVAGVAASDTVLPCSGGVVVLLAGGGTNYSWSNGSANDSVSISQPGDYTVTVADANGCTAAASVTIAGSNSPPVAAFTYSVNDTSVGFKNQSRSATDYLWVFGDGTSETESDPTHEYAGAGIYEVCLYASNSCGADTMCETIQYGNVGIEEVAGSLFISPNPFSNTIRLRWENVAEEPKLVELCTVAGQSIFRMENLQNGKSEMTVSVPGWLPNGMYVIKIFSAEKATIVKLVKTFN